MRRLPAIALAALALFLATGCRSLPPDEVKSGIHLLSEGIRDYVAHEQPEIEKRIRALREALERTEDQAERTQIERLLAQEEEYLRLGREIPPTLRELEDWAGGKALEKDGGGR